MKLNLNDVILWSAIVIVVAGIPIYYNEHRAYTEIITRPRVSTTNQSNPLIEVVVDGVNYTIPMDIVGREWGVSGFKTNSVLVRVLRK